MIIDYDKVTNHLVNWIRDYAKNAGKKVLVVNMSINIETALVAFLCKQTNLEVHGIYTDIDDKPEDRDVIKELVYNFEPIFINLKDTYSELVEQMQTQEHSNEYRAEYVHDYGDMVNYFNLDRAMANFKDVALLPVISSIASGFNGLIVGPENKNDLLIRAYNKYGSSNADILPLSDLYHSEIVELFYFIYHTNRYAKSYIIDKANNELPKYDTITNEEGEWADRENVRTNIITSEDDPIKHRDWQRYTLRQRQVIAKMHQAEKMSRHKYNPNIPRCAIRNLDGFVR